MKKIKKISWILLTVVLIFLLGLLQYSKIQKLNNVQFEQNSIGNEEDNCFAIEKGDNIIISIETVDIPFIKNSNNLYLLQKSTNSLTKIKNGQICGLQFVGDYVYYTKVIKGQTLSGIYRLCLRTLKEEVFVDNINFIEKFAVIDNTLIFLNDDKLQAYNMMTNDSTIIVENVSYFHVLNHNSIIYSSSGIVYIINFKTMEIKNLFDAEKDMYKVFKETKEHILFLQGESIFNKEICIYKFANNSYEILFKDKNILDATSLNEFLYLLTEDGVYKVNDELNLQQIFACDDKKEVSFLNDYILVLSDMRNASTLVQLLDYDGKLCYDFVLD